MIRFTNLVIPGNLLNIHVMAPRSMVTRVHHPTTRGETERRGGRSGRPIIIEMLIHDYTQFGTQQRFLRFEEKIWRYINEHGPLQIRHPDGSGSFVATHHRCTFDEFSRRRLDGQTYDGPLPDIQMTMGPGISWMMLAELKFYDLQP